MGGKFIEELLIGFGIVPDKKSFEEANSSLEKLVDRAKDFAKAMLALEGVKMLGELVIGVAENAERLSLASQELGVGVEELQKYEYAAKLAGVSTGELDLSLRFLLRNMSKAGEGSKEASLGFSQLGISVKGANGHVKTVEEALPEIADKFQKIEDPAKRVRIAMELFGRAGARMIPFLTKGSAGLAELGDEAEAFGSVLTKEQTEIGEGFLHNVRAIGAFFQGIKNTVGLSLIKTLGAVVKGTREWMKVNGSLVRQRVGDFFESLGKIIAGIAQLFVPLIKGVGFLYEALSDISPTLAVVTALLGGMALAFGVAAIPAILTAVAVGVLLIALEDIYQYFTGGKSVTGLIVNHIEAIWEAWTKPHPGESWFMAEIRKEALWITDTLKNLATLIKDFSPWGNLYHVGSDLAKLGGNLTSRDVAQGFKPGVSDGLVDKNAPVSAGPVNSNDLQLSGTSTPGLRDPTAPFSSGPVNQGPYTFAPVTISVNQTNASPHEIKQAVIDGMQEVHTAAHAAVTTVHN